MVRPTHSLNDGSMRDVHTSICWPPKKVLTALVSEPHTYYITYVAYRFSPECVCRARARVIKTLLHTATRAYFVYARTLGMGRTTKNNNNPTKELRIFYMEEDINPIRQLIAAQLIN